MKSRKLRLITKTICLIAIAVPIQLTAQHTDYTVTDLGTLGGRRSFAGGLNNKALVEGTSRLAGNTAVHAFLWRKGLMTDLGTLGGLNSFAGFRPSERGEAGGKAETATLDPLGEDFCGFGTHLICLPFVWRHGLLTPLPTLGGSNGSGNGMNSQGQLAGSAENITSDPTCVAPQVRQVKPVIWTKGEIQELPTVSGDPDGAASAINDRGHAVGFSGDCTSAVHAVLWQGDTATDLGNLGGTMGNSATDINNQDQVVGLSDLPGDTTFHAFLWQNGMMTDLGTLPGDVASTASGINIKGEVVGGSLDTDFNSRAFLWQNGVMTDLNTLIPPDSPLFLIEATGTINSRGQIGGLALEKSTGEVHAFLLTPSNSEFASESATLTTRGETSRGPKFVLPANVRKMLRESLAKPYLRGRLGDWNPK